MCCFLTVCNFLSFSRIFLTPFIVYFFFKGSWWLLAAVILFTVAVLTDFGDGYFARKFGKVSLAGTFLDPIADKILVTSLFGCFAVTGMIPWWFVVLVLVRDLSVTLWRIIHIKRCALISPSSLGKIKMVAQILFMYLLFLATFVKDYFGVDFQWYTSMMITIKIILYGVAGLTAYSGFDYFRRYSALKIEMRCNKK